MTAIPIKPEYGPTLGRLLSPRWKAASSLARRLVIAAAVALVALLVAVVLTVWPARYSHGGSLPFSFSYKGLWRTEPDPGGFVKLISRAPDGGVKDSFAVAPQTLPQYSGALSGELPLFAAGYARRLARYYPDYVPAGEGKTRINKVTTYEVLFTTTIGGHQLLGRAVLLFPQGGAARRGVGIVMLARPHASEHTPLEVASEGVLLKPLKTFAFG